MPRRIVNDRIWTDDGPFILYDLKRTFLGGKADVYTGNQGSQTFGKSKLLAWWSLGDTSISGLSTTLAVVDASGNGHTMSTESGKLPTPVATNPGLAGKVNSLAFSLASPQERLIADDSDIFSFGDGTSDSPFTLSVWIKPAALANGYILSKNNGSPDREWALRAIDGKVYLYLYDGSASAIAPTAAIAITVGYWYHIVATYDGRGGNKANDGVKIYVNGVSLPIHDTGSSAYVAMENTTARVTIGDPESSSTVFDGYIADVAIWKDVLDDESIRALYYAKDNVSYLARNWAHKGSTSVLVGQDIGLEQEDFVQGYNIRSLETLYMSTQPKIHANSDPIRTIAGRSVNKRWFDDNMAPLNLGDEGWSTSKGFVLKKSFFADGSYLPTINEPNVTKQFDDGDTGVTTTLYLTSSMARPSLDSAQAQSGITLAPNHVMENRDLGMTSLGNDDRPWTDMDRFNPLLVISTDPWDLELPAELLGASFSVYSRDIIITYDEFGNIAEDGVGLEPLTSDAGTAHGAEQHFGGRMRSIGEDSYSGISLMDGVIEPFPIRSVIDRSIIDTPFQTRGVRGGCEADDIFRRSISIEDQYMRNGNTYAPWLDGVELFGSDIAQQSGSFAMMGIVIDDPTLIRPFKDTTDIQIRYHDITDEEMKNILSQWNYVSGSRSLHSTHGGEGSAVALGAANLFVPPGTRGADLRRDHVYAAHGFDYIESPLGADSIVYGGLKR
jgi:hypothetical protein